MRRLLVLLAALAVSPLQATEIPAIAYHDIVDAATGDAYAITLRDFERQMAYLARRGYTPVSLRLLDDVRAGRARLPSKPVLLTFDDGLRSYYTHAFPVLERYRYPSVLSVVTAWVDARSLPDGYRTPLLTWDELRTLARSPLVEIASHTDDLHRGEPGNPWGSVRPAAVARIYRPETGRYETEARHRARVRADLGRAIGRLREELGVAPRAIAWPYGQYDGTLVEEAARLGMAYHMTLDIDPNRIDSLPRINRATFRRYRALADFGDALGFKAYRRQQLRYVQIDFDAFAGKDIGEQRRLVSRLVERLQLLRVNSVILRPFTADARRAFFPNGALPIESDLLSYVVHQIVSRADIFEIYMRLPAGIERMPPRFFADLGRHSRFSGLVLEAAEAGTVADVRSALEAYRPNLKLAVASTQPIPGTDYLFAEFDGGETPDRIARLARERAADGREVLFLIKGAENETATLRAHMRVLRAAGARHYGYGPDDFLGRVPDARQIAVPLSEHTIAVGRR
ncbi:hemin storage protein [Sulfurifustis variabilis]|uniref:Hemin storage protein n=1 Tax=Sulfurifustis variabilis TaxID=1675686 RepID=A0A1B4VBZ0_9GAMM|nr:polysaccharide deacetylase family protein [Sulfurifustis variabilis]BAU48531.1 hemin storage protein [Sulfurifustis variabilis]